MYVHLYSVTLYTRYFIAVLYECVMSGAHYVC